MPHLRYGGGARAGGHGRSLREEVKMTLAVLGQLQTEDRANSPRNGIGKEFEAINVVLDANGGEQAQQP